MLRTLVPALRLAYAARLSFNWINAPGSGSFLPHSSEEKIGTENLPKARFDLFLAVIEPEAAAYRGGQVAAENGMSPIGSAASDAHAGNKLPVLAAMPESRQLTDDFTTAFYHSKSMTPGGVHCLRLLAIF